MGDVEVNWAMQSVNNTAGVILCMWCEKSFRLHRKIIGNGFILLAEEWVKEAQQVNWLI